MKELLEDYQRRLKNVTDMLDNFTSNGSTNDIRKKERLTTKASEYRTFIAELERAIAAAEPAKPSATKGKNGNWTVPICRMSYGHKIFVVKARSEQEAIDKAMDEAGDWVFGEKSSEYVAPDGASRM